MAALVCTLWASFLFLHLFNTEPFIPTSLNVSIAFLSPDSGIQDWIESESVRHFLWQIIIVTELCLLFSSTDWNNFPPSYAVIDLQTEPCCCFFFFILFIMLRASTYETAEHGVLSLQLLSNTLDLLEGAKEPSMYQLYFIVYCCCFLIEWRNMYENLNALSKLLQLGTCLRV